MPYNNFSHFTISVISRIALILNQQIDFDMGVQFVYAVHVEEKAFEIELAF